MCIIYSVLDKKTLRVTPSFVTKNIWTICRTELKRYYYYYFI